MLASRKILLGLGSSGACAVSPWSVSSAICGGSRSVSLVGSGGSKVQDHLRLGATHHGFHSLPNL